MMKQRSYRKPICTHITLHLIYQAQKQSLCTLFAIHNLGLHAQPKMLRIKGDGRSVWLICKAVLGRRKNKLLIRGVEGAEWVLCPLIKGIKRDRVSVDRCQRCKYFVGFQQTYVPQTQKIRKSLSFRSTALKGTFHAARPMGRLNTTHLQATPFPHIPSLIKQREPLIDILEEENHIVVLAELLGVNENDINIKADENTLTISIDTPTKKYLKKFSFQPLSKKTRLSSCTETTFYK